MHKLTGLVLALAIALALPSASIAQKAIPPGNSGADEYTEGVPGAGGEQPGGQKNGSGPAPSLPPSTAQDLEALGADGAAAANLAQASAPNSGALRDSLNSEGNGSSTAGGADVPISETRDGNVVGDALGALDGTGDDGGLGIGLPIILALALVVAAALFAARRGRSGTEAT